MRDEKERAVLEALERTGVIRLQNGIPHTTRRFQGAMARAEKTLFELGDANEDLRVPIALALLDLGGSHLTDEEVADMVDVLMPIEVGELSPKRGRHPSNRPSFNHRHNNY